VGKVVELCQDERRDLSTVEALQALLAHAKAGRITGVCIAWRSSTGGFDAVTTGVYQDNPIEALGAASRLWAKINSTLDH
jgi:hypothetical protein